MSYCFQCNVSVKYEKQNLEFMKLKLFKCDFRTPHVYIVGKIKQFSWGWKAHFDFGIFSIVIS